MCQNSRQKNDNGFYPGEQQVAEDANLSFKPDTLFGIRPANRPQAQKFCWWTSLSQLGENGESLW